MIRNVILDWSGTVVDDLRPVIQATNASLAEFNFPEITPEEFRAEFCLPMVPFYEKRMAGIAMEVINESYNRHFPKFAANVGPLPNSKAFLEFCKKTGRRLFVLSRITHSHFEQQAAEFGFTDFFECVYTEIVDKREKIREILQDHDLLAEETLFAGDMVHDVETAQHAGVLAIALLSGYDDATKLAAAQPDVMVRHLGDLQILMEAPEVISKGLIRIEGLEIDARVGISDEEISSPQRLLLDVEIVPKRAFSKMNDDIRETVDYFTICETVRTFVVEGKWRLIETLAVAVRELVLLQPNVASARVKVRKFILRYTEQVSVET